MSKLPECTCWELDPIRVNPTCPRHGKQQPNLPDRSDCQTTRQNCTSPNCDCPRYPPNLSTCAKHGRFVVVPGAPCPECRHDDDDGHAQTAAGMGLVESNLPECNCPADVSAPWYTHHSDCPIYQRQGRQSPLSARCTCRDECPATEHDYDPIAKSDEDALIERLTAERDALRTALQRIQRVVELERAMYE